MNKKSEMKKHLEIINKNKEKLNRLEKEKKDIENKQVELKNTIENVSEQIKKLASDKTKLELEKLQLSKNYTTKLLKICISDFGSIVYIVAQMSVFAALISTPMFSFLVIMMAIMTIPSKVKIFEDKLDTYLAARSLTKTESIDSLNSKIETMKLEINPLELELEQLRDQQNDLYLKKRSIENIKVNCKNVIDYNTKIILDMCDETDNDAKYQEEFTIGNQFIKK